MKLNCGNISKKIFIITFLNIVCQTSIIIFSLDLFIKSINIENNLWLKNLIPSVIFFIINILIFFDRFFGFYSCIMENYDIILKYYNSLLIVIPTITFIILVINILQSYYISQLENFENIYEYLYIIFDYRILNFNIKFILYLNIITLFITYLELYCIDSWLYKKRRNTYWHSENIITNKELKEIT